MRLNVLTCRHLTGTGIAQPADIGLQRLVKHHVKRSATDFIVARATRQLAKGVPPTDVELPTQLPVLQNASIKWFLDVYQYFDAHPEVVRKAWANCSFDSPSHGTLTLSAESVMSSQALEHSEHLFKTNSVLKAEWSKFSCSKTSFMTVSGDPNAKDATTYSGLEDNTDVDIHSLASLLSQPGQAHDSLPSDLTADDNFRPDKPNGDSASSDAASPPSPSSTNHSIQSSGPPELPHTPIAPLAFHLDIAAQGGTDYAASLTGRELAVTNKAARKPRASTAKNAAALTNVVDVSMSTDSGAQPQGVPGATSQITEDRLTATAPSKPKPTPKPRKRKAQDVEASDSKETHSNVRAKRGRKG